jgi:hypothetical protein
MSRARSCFVGATAIALALAAGKAFESVYSVTIRVRQSAASTPPANTNGPSAPLPLRLVDSGGVGIPLGGDWGTDYSHDLRVFRDVILKDPPYVDAAAFSDIDRQWRAYVERMREYGNNAMVVPVLLELIDFNRADGRRGDGPGVAVYDARSPFRQRHDIVRRHFGPLFEWTNLQGMKVFLGTDMLALTPPLFEYLRQLSPESNATGIDTSDPAVWHTYRAGLEELFDALPSIEGLVVRIGEAGALYNTEGWDYRSEMAVRDAASLRAMLQGLLPLFESRGKTLVLRSWTVGVGPIGRLHVDPRVYEAVLADIDSPALIISTKYTAGDFFTHLPLNPTLGGGRHRRLIELQARPEFEGFGAFPNYLAEDYALALRALTSVNPRIAGTYLWSQLGGPLRAGPRSLYPRHGFWLWTDANVFAASRLALDRNADVDQLAAQWAMYRFGGDTQVATAVATVLQQTRDAVRGGFYIRPFAEREVRVTGLELPPLMWIFDWDRIGGWHSLLSLVYLASRDSVDLAIDEGDAAAVTVRQARQSLQRALAAANPETCGRICDNAVRSLEYQETLFEALAAWRQAFLSYYRWLETGRRDDWHRWTSGRQRFEIAAARHVSRFGRDLDFPAFDFTSAHQTVLVASRTTWVRSLAAALLGIVALLASGGWRHWRGVTRLADGICRTAWIGAMAPWRLAHEAVDARSLTIVTVGGLVLVAFLSAALAGFTTPWVSVGAVFVIGSVALASEISAIRVPGGDRRGRLIVATVAPLLPGTMVLLGLVAYGGPLGFWYGFWISPTLRMTVVTTLIAMALWTTSVTFATHPGRWHRRLGGSFMAFGAGLLALTVWLPNWLDVLRFLDRPLNFAPATDTMLIALQVYVGVSLDTGMVPWLLGALLIAGGSVLSLRRSTASA